METTSDTSSSGLLRGTTADKREDRATVDTGSGIKRVPGNRAAHMDRGNFINFYEDLGISSTPEGAKSIRADEAAFQSDVKEQKGKISVAQTSYNKALSEANAAQAKIDAAKASIPGFSEAYADSWNDYQSNNLTKFRVVDSNNNIQASYYVPQSVVNEYLKDGNLWVTQVSGNVANIATNTKSGNTIGGELHSALTTTSNQVATAFSEKASPEISSQIRAANNQISSQQGLLTEARVKVDAYGNEISSAKKLLQASVDNREAEWDAIHTKYQKRQDTMKEIFSGLNIEKGSAPDA